LLTKDDIDCKLELVSALDRLKNDYNQDVSETAFDCDDRANIKYKESEEEYRRKCYKEENFLKREQEMAEKNICEES
jgi:hypothetical protein